VDRGIAARVRATVHNLVRQNIIIIIIIIMTRRRLWSVATALRNVHAPLHSATSVSSWLLFRRQSAVSMSFEDDQNGDLELNSLQHTSLHLLPPENVL